MQRSFESRLAWLEHPDVAPLVQRGLRGIEKESLRVTADGRLAKTPHPRALGSALTHPYLTTDYSEALLEFVTPPLETNWESLRMLCNLHAFVHGALDSELLWPASMPCVLNANEEIPIAEYGTSNPGRMRSVYRSGLGLRYGRAMQAIAGTHFNYSPPPAFWQALGAAEAPDMGEAELKSERLMGLVRNFRRYGCLAVYLFGESPAFCKSFYPDGHELLSELDPTTWHAPWATSLRMSDMGYRNRSQSRLNVSANSLAEYVDGLTHAISTVDPAYAAIGVVQDGEYRQLNANVLQIENEYYTSIRPKPAARDVRPTVALARDGVEYVEVRTLDLSLADPVGISQQQMRFLEAFLVFCLLEPSPPIGADEQAEIDARDLTIARRGREPGLEVPVAGRTRDFRDWGRGLMDRVAGVAAALDAGRDEGYRAAADEGRRALDDPERTPSARLLATLRAEGAGFFEYVLDVAERHRGYFLALGVDPAERERLETLAARSLAETEALEAERSESFEQYLARYFGTGSGADADRNL